MKNIPAEGTCIVLCNGYLNEFIPDVCDFQGGTYEEARAYVDIELNAYPDLHYYICPITEFHHCTVTRHVRKMGS